MDLVLELGFSKGNSVICTATHITTLLLETLEHRDLLAYTPLDAFVEGNPAESGAYFGSVVAMSGDLAVVGAALEDSAGVNAGAAYVYQRVGETWVEQARLLPSDPGANIKFGSGVAIDGDRILVAAVHDNDLGAASGSVFVFRNAGGTWVEEAKLLANDGSTAQWFGSYVDLDGEFAVIGAQRDGTLGGSAGAAYVFQRTGNSWQQVSKLTASDGSQGDLFGSMVSISGDTILVGAPLQDEGAQNAGAVYVFDRSGSSWTETAKILASDATAGDGFGLSLDINGDTAVIGSPYDASLGVDAGAAYVYRRTGGVWVEEAKLLADQFPKDLFGRSVAVYGNDIIVGSPYADEAALDAGAAYHYQLVNGSWTLVDKYAAGNPSEFATFGWHVAVSGDYFFVGSPLGTGSQSLSGLAYPGTLRLPQFSQTDLTVAQGGQGTIGTGNLNVTVQTWSSTSIIYTLTSLTSNGVLQLNGVDLVVGDTFTQADIDEGRLSYVHDGGDSVSDSFDFFVSNTAGNLLVDGVFNITITAVVPPDPGPIPSALSNFIAPFPPDLTRPERGLAFDPPFPDDIYGFDPSVGGPSVGRRFLTGDSIILAQAIAERELEDLLPKNVPADLFRQAERIFDAIAWPSADEKAAPAVRPEAPRNPGAEPPRLDSTRTIPQATPNFARDAVFESQAVEGVSLLVLESFLQHASGTRNLTELFTDQQVLTDPHALLAAILLVPASSMAKAKKSQKEPQKSELPEFRLN